MNEDYLVDEPEDAEADEHKGKQPTRTFYLDWDLLKDLDRLQLAWEVPTQSELVRWLLLAALEGIRDGTLELPEMEETTRAILWEDD